MIEPAAYGAAVSFGPNTRNFRDIVAQLLMADAAVVVRDGHDLTTFVERCLEDPNLRETSGSGGASWSPANWCATGRTLAGLDRLMPHDAQQHAAARSAA